MRARKLKRPAMPGAGRPRLLNGRRNVITIKLSDDEEERYRAAAGEAGLGEWLRTAAEAQLVREARRK